MSNTTSSAVPTGTSLTHTRFFLEIAVPEGERGGRVTARMNLQSTSMQGSALPAALPTSRIDPAGLLMVGSDTSPLSSFPARAGLSS